jgi:hypothetical protein
MKNFGAYLFYMFSYSLLMSCVGPDPCHRASDNIITETRDLKDFRGIAFTSLGDIYITQGPEYSFTIKGPDNVVGFTTTRIENELLVITTEECFNGEYELSIEITAPEYTFINLAGLATLTSVSEISGDLLVMELVGIGVIEADVYVDSLYTTISGNGTVNYTGEVSRHFLSSSGEFRLNGYSLQTDHTFINLTGIGDSYVHANESLTVEITGTGKVFYQGDPDIYTDITGNGEVIDDN